MPFSEIQANWTWAGSGNGGVSKFKFLGALNVVQAGGVITRVNTFFNALITFLPAQVTISFPLLTQIFDEGVSTPGGGAQLIDEVVATAAPTPVVGTGTGVWSAASGAWINWLTTGFANGRRIVGRTFLVPLSNTNSFQTDGTLSSGLITALTNAGNTLNSGTPQHVIYFNRGGPSDPPKPTDKPHVFGIQTATGVTVPDRAGVLRSRRDA